MNPVPLPKMCSFLGSVKDSLGLWAPGSARSQERLASRSIHLYISVNHMLMVPLLFLWFCRCSLLCSLGDVELNQAQTYIENESMIKHNPGCYSSSITPRGHLLEVGSSDLLVESALQEGISHNLLTSTYWHQCSSVRRASLRRHRRPTSTA
jgi:hypothetical protein